MGRLDGYYWLWSERASTRGIGQYLQGMWWLINRAGPITESTLINTGWRIGDYVGPAVVRHGDFYNGPSILTEEE